MLHRIALLIAMLLFLLGACKSNDADSNIVVLEHWQVSRGLHLPQARELKGLTAENLGPDSANWKETNLPVNLSQTDLASDYTGWITLRHALPEKLNRRLRADEILALNAGRVLDVSAYCLNEHCFGQLGQESPYKPGAMRPFLRGIPLQSIQEKNYIYIAVYSNGQYPFQFMDPVQLGPVNEIFAAHREREILAFVFLTIYVAWGGYHILLYLRRRKDRYNIYFGLGSVLLSMYWFAANTFTRDLVFSDHVEIHRRVEHFLLFLIPPFFLAFVIEFCDRRTTLIAKVYAVYCMVTAGLVLFVPLPVMRIARDLWYLMLIAALCYMLYFLVRQALARNRDAWFIVFGTLIVAIALVHDILVASDFIHTPKIGSFAFVFLVSGLAALMASRFMRVTNEVEELNRDLDQKVKSRTAELQDTMESLRELKEQQDGDYYLTSLLLGPIGGDLAASRGDVSILVEQKKKFEFKSRASEIGGDICVADRIELRGLKYRVFLNGDAMGKSVQGAGGAMVLGTVFRSNLARTQLFEHTQDLYPEQWMHRAYLELETVFRPFDGTMMASFLLALVEEQTGFAYLLNVEHPWAVLLRSGEAHFIQTESDLRKIGVTLSGGPGAFRIDTVRLLFGDRLILGSDGRDDLWMSDGGERSINNDETRFLYVVEETDGDLMKIRGKLTEIGDLSDDLSLLSYRFGEEMQPPARDALYGLLKAATENPGVIPELIQQAEQILAAGAEAEESLYRVAAAFQIAGSQAKGEEYLQRALLISRRLYLRNPFHGRNLLLLIHLYDRLDQRAIAREMLGFLQQLRPDDPRVHNLAARLS